jgi:hypothetical protein
MFWVELPAVIGKFCDPQNPLLQRIFIRAVIDRDALQRQSVALGQIDEAPTKQETRAAVSIHERFA